MTALKLWDALAKKAKTEVGRKLLCICHLLLSHPNCIQNRGQRTSSSKRIRVTWEGTSEYKMDAQGVAWQPASMLLPVPAEPKNLKNLSLALPGPVLHSSTVAQFYVERSTFPHCAELQFHSLSYVRRGQPSWQKERCDARELKENISETPTDRKMSFWQENMGFIQVYCLV